MNDRQKAGFMRATVCIFGLSILGACISAGCRGGRALEQAPIHRTPSASANHVVKLDARQTATFISYNRSITLTAAQQKIMREALSSIPAPCCAKYSMATCCCPCNLAKSAWGLSKYLIAQRHYTAPELKKTVLQWLRVSNPGGFTGDACFKGGCNRPLAKNGCGGMNEQELISGG